MLCATNITNDRMSEQWNGMTKGNEQWMVIDMMSFIETKDHLLNY